MTFGLMGEGMEFLSGVREEEERELFLKCKISNKICHVFIFQLKKARKHLCLLSSEIKYLNDIIVNDGKHAHNICLI